MRTETEERARVKKSPGTILKSVAGTAVERTEKAEDPSRDKAAGGDG